MGKHVYEFLKENPESSHHQVAKVFDISEAEALRLLNSLVKKRMVQVRSLPLGNTKDPNCSAFYSATGRVCPTECVTDKETIVSEVPR